MAKKEETEMADSPRKKDLRSPSPVREQSRSRSRSRSLSRSRSRSRSWSRPRQRSRSRSRGRSRSRSRGSRTETVNPGNTLYVTGLSTRVTERDLEKHFSKEGKVDSCFLVVEPRTRISRGFAFVTMDTLEDADRCIKYLNQSVLEGRYITVERSRRKRPRTPTPGHYLGLKSSRDIGYRGDRGDRGRYRSSRDDYGYRRSPRRSPFRGGRDYSPRRSPHSGRSRRDRSRSQPHSPYGSPERKYSRGSR
ncbi:serine/arginine-rich splicing factor SR45a [Melia azedarach]|uniref:Serine/arginine-rich splicing factor SR45a n=1 Tax=Melia azedarach TaxID=155640 RepID=A0ACC1XRJ6_MELAZ|nr:serine/arginine-rich splicing factor SR45a [Melia azedarach]